MELEVIRDLHAGVDKCLAAMQRGADTTISWLREEPMPTPLGTLSQTQASSDARPGSQWVFLEGAAQYWEVRSNLRKATSKLHLVFPEPQQYELARPPVYLVSPPKAGTHLMVELLRVMGYTHGGVCPLRPKAGHFYSLFQPSFHAEPVTPLNHYNDAGHLMGGRLLPLSSGLIVALFRDPVALVASALDYEFDARQAVLGLAEYEDGAEKLDSFLDSNQMHGQRLTYLNRYAEWLRFPNVFPIAFEELSTMGSTAQREAVEALQLALCAEGSTENFIDSAWGSSDTYRGGDAPSRVPIPPDKAEEIRRLAAHYLERSGRFDGDMVCWVHRREKAHRPSDSRPTGIDLELARGSLYVLFYRDGRVVARLMQIDADPPADIGSAYPYLQREFESVETANAWTIIQERAILDGLPDIEQGVSTFQIRDRP